MQFLDLVLEASQDSKERETKLIDFVDLIPQGSSTTNSIKTTGYETDEQLANLVRNAYATSVSIQKFVTKHFGVKVLRFIEPTSFLRCRAEQFLLSRIGSGNVRF